MKGLVKATLCLFVDCPLNESGEDVSTSSSVPIELLLLDDEITCDFLLSTLILSCSSSSSKSSASLIIFELFLDLGGALNP